jgi:hypothetical protein
MNQKSVFNDKMEGIAKDVIGLICLPLEAAARRPVVAEAPFRWSKQKRHHHDLFSQRSLLSFWRADWAGNLARATRGMNSTSPATPSA